MIDPIINHSRDQMKKAIEITQNDISSIRSGRATPALIENIVVSVYGATQKLKVREVATITTMDAKTLVISPFDPSIIAEIEHGISAANTGLSPVVDGEIIRISLPPLSEERRQEYIKLVHTKLEGGRIMVRQARAQAMKDLKDFPEDERKHGEKVVQELTDEMIAEIDTLGEKKEAELLQI